MNLSLVKTERGKVGQSVNKNIDFPIEAASLHEFNNIVDRLIQIGQSELRLTLLAERKHVKDKIGNLAAIAIDHLPAFAKEFLIVILESLFDHVRAAFHAL